jgi:uncharacterized protein YfaS (alpha-2-macroglobulin family)
MTTRTFLAMGSLLLISSAAARAQVTTADLVGTIKDSSGAVVPGVTVSLTNEATGVVRSTTTSESGRYFFTSLQPGRYRLAAELSGFRKIERTPRSTCVRFQKLWIARDGQPTRRPDLG